MESSSPAPSRKRHPTSPSSKRLPTPKTTEVWDEDFEFPTLALPKGKKAETPRKSDAGPSKQEEDWGEENWDESPPGPSRLPIASLGKRKSPTQPDFARLSLNSPRASDSISSDIHLPCSPTSPGPSSRIAASSSALQLIAGPSGTGASNDTKQRTRSGSTGRKLIKRHPSTSFIHIGSSSSIDDLVKPPPVPANRSSYDLSRPAPTPPPPLPRSKSGEQMPPPALPSGLIRPRSKSKSKVRPISRQGDVRVSAIPLSPSQDHVANVDQPRRPSFWKRLSGQPLAGTGEPVNAPGSYSIKVQHRRSASIGRLSKQGREERPPVPPIPANLRSPSATSTSSTTSVSSFNKSGPSTLSAILRRTASGLSRKSSHDRPPPSSFPYANRSQQGSTASIDSVPPTPPLPEGIASSHQRSPLIPSLPTSHSFSAGYHLPSPSPHSPYRPSLGSTTASADLPHSASFPLARSLASDSDTETEAEGPEQTPRRKKIRPVSALPAPRTGISRGWNAEGWRGFSDQGAPGSSRILDLGKRSASSESPAASTSSPRTANFAMSTANTIRRIGSISKKHGRRLSGGFMFGGPAPAGGREGSSSTFLEPVQGSPSKPGRLADELEQDTRTSYEEEESIDEAREMREGSASAPTSTFRHSPFGPGMTSSMSEATIMGTVKTDKERRRQSWNDFVIPKSIMEMQSGLNKNRSAIKQFDVGIKRLESLLDSREQARQKAEMSDSDSRTFDRLEQDFREEWAIACVLVRVGNTGRAESGNGSARVSSDSAGTQDSPRSRRITMANDEARAAGEVLRSASDGTTPVRSPLSDSSAPSPTPLSPPRALTEKWRASTGRHDLTPRELELLRNIMNTPVSQRPSSGARQASTISSSSSIPSIRASGSGKTITGSATVRLSSKSAASDQAISRVRLPSPSDSPFIIESGSFPSPTTASALAVPKNYRGQKTGFAGFKDFLRTMSIKGNVPSSPSGRRLNFMSSSPTSPTFPVKSPLMPGSSPQPSIEAALQPTPGLTDRQKKRTSVRNIFRSSSGDWSGLVKGEKKEGSAPLPPPLPRQPSRPDLNSSRQTSPKRRISLKQKMKSPEIPSAPTPVDDRTIRPGQNQGRKSRIIGLGWPEMEDGLPVPSSTSGTPPRPPPIRRLTTSDKETTAAAIATGHGKEGSEYSTWSNLPDPEEEGDGQPQKPRAASAQSDDFTVVLTPENLPRMLEYVQECERTLGVWKTRAKSLLSD